MLFVRTWYQASLPTSIVDNLSASIRLRELEQAAKHERLVNEYVIESIAAFNVTTCDLSQVGLSASNGSYSSNQLACFEPLSVSLPKLIISFVDNIHRVTNVDRGRFTLGVYLSYYYSTPPSSQRGSDGQTLLSYDEGILLFRDELGLQPHLSDDIFHDIVAKGNKLKFQGCIRSCFNDKSFINCSIEGEYRFIGNYIPQVCEVSPEDDLEARGVIFIITAYDESDQIPDNTESSLRIIARIITNFLYNHDECTFRQYSKPPLNLTETVGKEVGRE